MLPSAHQHVQPHGVLRNSPHYEVGQAFQPAGSGDFQVAGGRPWGWKAPLTGRLESLPYMAECQKENCRVLRSSRPFPGILQSAFFLLPSLPVVRLQALLEPCWRFGVALGSQSVGYHQALVAH